ncbi:hypothetical protein [Moraxella atlantae]|uniref:Uncharacterized protein n=1 Tax=Faucicola atlantae TaxID=34059 RepID=A0A378Q7C1_9GAMM|nr:hypothetical protein [Moraxella atlantae]STY96098.1 Uncharacterised protein [Moraxella atlantae]
MRYVFIALLLANIALFGYYSFLRKPNLNAAVTPPTALTNPVSVTNVSDELPPLIGKK